MEDYFSTLTKEEIEVNLRLLESFENNKTKSINNDNVDNNATKIVLPNYLDNLPNNDYAKCFKIGFEQLNEFQKDIFHECVMKNCSVSLNLPLGSGKTIISIILSLYLNMNNNGLTLIVVSKSLISSWQDEITKFYGTGLNYEIIHPSVTKNIHQWKISNKTLMILTSIDVLSKSYKDNHIDKLFIDQRFVTHNGHLGSLINYYKESDKPYINHVIGQGILYSIKWGCLIVDEVQTYTNISTLRCQSLGALNVQYRYLLSGTLFDEPKVERILGYHVILNAPNKPRSVPDTKELLKSSEFKGLNEHTIHRKKNLAFVPPILNDVIITHDLSIEETKIYTMMKEILVVLRNKSIEAKLNNDKAERKLFNSYKLVMILYLRQAIICPLIPITSVIIDSSDAEKKSQLATIILKELQNLNIDHYLNDINSVKSTRLTSALSVLNKHDERCIVFSCFVSCLDLLKYFITGRPVFHLMSEMSSPKRKELLDKFEDSKNGILLTTYDLACTGFNLQHARVVLLLDFWWSSSKSKQSIGRVFRYGQQAKEVFVYFFSSNTGIEKIIFEKQNAKLVILEELKTGQQTTKVPSVKMDDIIKMIEVEINKDLLTKVQKRIY